MAGERATDPMLNSAQARRITVAFGRQAAKVEAGLCAACLDLLRVSGAGITLMGGRQAGPVCAAGPNTAALQDLQFTLGEGPCRDAFRDQVPVFAGELDGVASERWPSFSALATEFGVRAVFSFPITASRSRVGVLTIYQDRVGDLSATQESDGLALAASLAETILAMQAASAPGMVPDDLDAAVLRRAEFHQAGGMVSVQLGVPVADALDLIRAHAYAHHRLLDDVALDVVTRRLRLRLGDTDGSGGGAVQEVPL